MDFVILLTKRTATKQQQLKVYLASFLISDNSMFSTVALLFVQIKPYSHRIVIIMAPPVIFGLPPVRVVCYICVE